MDTGRSVVVPVSRRSSVYDVDGRSHWKPGTRRESRTDGDVSLSLFVFLFFLGRVETQTPWDPLTPTVTYFSPRPYTLPCPPSPPGGSGGETLWPVWSRLPVLGETNVGSLFFNDSSGPTKRVRPSRRQSEPGPTGFKDVWGTATHIIGDCSGPCPVDKYRG